MLSRLKFRLFFCLPKKWLTEFLGWCANRRAGWLTKISIDIFIWFYKIDISNFRKIDTGSYQTFNDFFVREFKKGMRFIDPGSNIIVSPVDGLVTNFGRIDNEKIFQAKNKSYTLISLLAGREEIAEKFHNGHFFTIYLGPYDYHRVHMPCNGILRKMIYVPGDLYALNTIMESNISNLFARNERVICYFDTDFGPMLQILVGAIIVGSIETVWMGTVTPPRDGIVKVWNYPSSKNESGIVLLKGYEMGRFKFGSTVINLFSFDRIKMLEGLRKKCKVQFGQALATSLPLKNEFNSIIEID